MENINYSVEAIIEMHKNYEFDLDLIELSYPEAMRFNYSLEFRYQHKTYKNLHFVLKRHYSYVTKRIVFTDNPYFTDEPALFFEDDELISKLFQHQLKIENENKLMNYLLKLWFIKNFDYSKMPKLFEKKKLLGK